MADNDQPVFSMHIHGPINVEYDISIEHPLVEAGNGIAVTHKSTQTILLIDVTAHINSDSINITITRSFKAVYGPYSFSDKAWRVTRQMVGPDETYETMTDNPYHAIADMIQAQFGADCTKLREMGNGE